MGPCFSSSFSSGQSIDINVQVSLLAVTPLPGCATFASCVQHDEGVDDKPTDDAGAPGLGEGACSFTARTKVATEHGEQAISKVKAGDKVWAYNPKTHTMELQPILHVWVHSDHDLVDLTITTIIPARHGRPATQANEIIHTNQKHPFLTQERGFLPVAKIKVGMHVLRADGSFGMVTGWKMVPGIQTMYNLEVAQDHTFTVGDGQWVVHNCSLPEGEAGSVTYSRVQGGTPPNASHSRISVNVDGSISIENTSANLNVSVGTEHAYYFQGIRGDSSEIVQFDLPTWFDDFVAESAIEQYGCTKNPANQGGTVPKIVDPTTPGISYEFPPPWIQWIEEYATNGRVIR